MTRPGTVVGCVVALAAVLTNASPARSGARELEFQRSGARVSQLSLSELLEACRPLRIEVDDPYYGRRKAFHAMPLGCVLAQGFGRPMDQLSGESFFLRARDGYTRPASGTQLAQPGAHIAFADADGGSADQPRWEPIDRRQVDPGPFYMIWSGETQNDPHRFPWPYQLATIEIAPFEREFPHTIPTSAEPGSPARRGFEIFRSECIACHAINGEGGNVGPDLNVPRSIVEYRPAEQIRAFVRDPATFRYTSMPAHGHLGDADLDALIAYFEAMSELKRDPKKSQ